MSECRGKVIGLGELRTGESSRGKWMSQQWVVEELNTQYPERWVLDSFGEDKIKEFDVHVGDIVDVQYSSRSTEKDGHFYASNRPWSVIKQSGGTPSQVSEATASPSA